MSAAGARRRARKPKHSEVQWHDNHVSIVGKVHVLSTQGANVFQDVCCVVCNAAFFAGRFKRKDTCESFDEWLESIGVTASRSSVVLSCALKLNAWIPGFFVESEF